MRNQKNRIKTGDEVEVVLDLDRLGPGRTIGRLFRQRSHPGDVFSFEYERGWLDDPRAFALDPELQLAEGRAFAGRSNFGIFLDSAPDRWGRVLMQRRAALHARKTGARAPTLTDWDYLLGVHDEARLGALRFRANAEAPYLDDDSSNAAPPITSLSELQGISLKLEGDEPELDQDYEKWLAALVAPGSSLGGARPKAMVRDEERRLCIAKFPSRSDLHDVGGWELVLNRLAERAGIGVPESRALRLGDLGHTFVARRFDRTVRERRRFFVSAMTLLQREDGESGASYLELVELLQSRGGRAQADCVELFRRVCFNVCTSNTDDHLRNHGCFIEPEGLVLAPAYDLNPNPSGQHLSLAIDELDASLDLAIARDAASSYGLSPRQAGLVIDEVRAAVATWREEAKVLGLRRAEVDRMAGAFRC
jgi:serine/threonine-protein kinase HipA